VSLPQTATATFSRPRIAIGIEEIHLNEFTTIRKLVGVVPSFDLGEDLSQGHHPTRLSG
jgi:hypothetical protein